MNKTNNKKAKRAHNLRRWRYGTTSTVVTVAVIVAVLLLNIVVDIVADRFPVSLDLSSDKVFTLSEQSEEVAKSIQSAMEIVIFAPEEEFKNPNLAASGGVAEFDTLMHEFYNAMRQYVNLSDNQVEVKYIDTTQEPAAFAAYEKRYAVEEYDILFVSGDKYKVCNIEDIYAIETDENTGNYIVESKVEKVLASTIHTLQSGNEQTVQVLVGHEEDSYTVQGLQELYELNGYVFEELNIAGSTTFNDKATVAIIPAPTTDYSAAEIDKVRQWVYNDGNYGRHLVVYTDATASCPNLYEFLQVEYKIQVHNELILETDFNRIQNYSYNYPMADIPETDYTRTANSKNKLFTPNARRLTTTLEAPSEDSQGTMQGVVLTNYPETAQLIALKDFENASQNGIDSAYDAPVAEYPLTSMVMAVIDSYNNNTSQDVFGTVTVAGSAEMAYPAYVRNGNFRNEELLLDTLNGATGTENSVSITNKRLTGDTLYFTDQTEVILGIGVFTVGIPVVVLVICLIVFLRRQHL